VSSSIRRIILSLFVLALVISGCKTPTLSPPTETPAPSLPTEVPAPSLPTETPAPSVNYVREEVLISGTPDAMRQLDELKIEGLTLGKPVSIITATINADFLRPGKYQEQFGLPPKFTETLGSIPAGVSGLVPYQIRLYLPTCLEPPDPATCTLELLQDRTQNLFVEYNLLTGSTPHQVGGSPAGGIKPDAALDRGDFTGQWAFESIKLDYRPDAGQGVVIGVFDTSPFPVLQQPVTVPESDGSNWQIQVTESYTRTFPREDPLVVWQVPDHGLFAASLAHHVAPASQIELLPVLNAAGLGSTADLDAAILAFNRRHAKDKAVINLSLGVVTVDQAADSLTLTLLDALSQGIVVVAAAGNDSNETVYDSNLPASLSPVLGVAATSQANQRACFSNRVPSNDISAPGGQGEPTCLVIEQPSQMICDSQDKTTWGSCLIGRVWTLKGASYGFGRGTSFATPLVTGLAARLLAGGTQVSTSAALNVIAEITNATNVSPPASPDPNLGAGIINVQRTAP
jgi:hypothetical protein